MKIFNTGKILLIKSVISISRYIDFKFEKDEFEENKYFIQVPFIAITITFDTVKRKGE